MRSTSGKAETALLLTLGSSSYVADASAFAINAWASF